MYVHTSYLVHSYDLYVSIECGTIWCMRYIHSFIGERESKTLHFYFFFFWLIYFERFLKSKNYFVLLLSIWFRKYWIYEKWILKSAWIRQLCLMCYYITWISCFNILFIFEKNFFPSLSFLFQLFNSIPSGLCHVIYYQGDKKYPFPEGNRVNQECSE